jgi:hypothetical protein
VTDPLLLLLLVQAVTKAEGDALAREYNMSFFETSAKRDIGVSEAFLAIARQVVERLSRDGGGRPPPAKAGATTTSGQADAVNIGGKQGGGGGGGCKCG